MIPAPRVGPEIPAEEGDLNCEDRERTVSRTRHKRSGVTMRALRNLDRNLRDADQADGYDSRARSPAA